MLSRFVEEGSKVELRAPIGGYTGDFHANGTDQTDPSAGGKRI